MLPNLKQSPKIRTPRQIFCLSIFPLPFFPLQFPHLQDTPQPTEWGLQSPWDHGRSSPPSSSLTTTLFLPEPETDPILSHPVHRRTRAEPSAWKSPLPCLAGKLQPIPQASGQAAPSLGSLPWCHRLTVRPRRHPSEAHLRSLSNEPLPTVILSLLLRGKWAPFPRAGGWLARYPSINQGAKQELRNIYRVNKHE